MRLALRAMLCILLLGTVLAPVFAQGDRVATITLGRDPEPPYCVTNPGGSVDIFWEIEHTTTPRYVYYKLEDPTRTIILEQQTYPGGTGLNISRTWTVPNGLLDGKYWVRVEYWSFQAGNEANAEVTFYVCAEAGNLCVWKFKDANCNGELDPSDPPVSGWWVCLETPEGDTICQQTNGEGKYCWFSVPLGDYTVFEPPVDGWLPVGPDSYEIVLDGSEVQNVTFLNVRYDECFGACCLDDGTCVEIGEPDCLERGGVFHGYGSTCAGVTCPQPEACCFPDGHCEFVLVEVCQAAGGIPYGPGSDCDPNPCRQPEACCFPDGHCELIQVDLCNAMGGVPQGPGSDCDPNPCPQPQACCFEDGHCEYVLGDCPPGGVPQGPGTDCDPNPCPPPPPPGACCFPDGSCTYVLEADCEAAGGLWQGPDTVCDPNPCPPPVPVEGTTWGQIRAKYR